jgi:hypothetical protein
MVERIVRRAAEGRSLPSMARACDVAGVHPGDLAEPEAGAEGRPRR